MIARYLTLTGLIRSELAELERTAKVIEKHWSRAPRADDPDAYVGSVALNLRALYSGIERMLEQIARDVDGRVPTSEAWHSELLNQMLIEVPSIRPPVLDKMTVGQLDHYRRFRHRVRNVYATLLDPALMQDIVDGLPSAIQNLHRDLDAFCEFLTIAAYADED